MKPADCPPAVCHSGVFYNPLVNLERTDLLLFILKAKQKSQKKAASILHSFNWE